MPGTTPGSRWVPASIAVPTADRRAFWQTHTGLLGALPSVGLQPMQVLDADARALAELEARSIAAVAGGVELLIPAEGLFDVQRERQRADQELDQTRKQIQRLEDLLASDFARKAPTETVEREREKLAAQRDRLATLERRRATLERLGRG